jgi:hypothetical protein
MSDPDSRKAWRSRCEEMQKLMEECKIITDSTVDRLNQVRILVATSRFGIVNVRKIREILAEPKPKK